MEFKMLVQILLGVVGVGLIALSWPHGAASDASTWWGVAGGVLIVIGAVLAIIRTRQATNVARDARDEQL
ncbi:hypothetical protein [Clavibacter sp. VKM Ac-2872]|uniref:hypothetical protein n=1 Tax=Clavibacter sp. VKM Ac-2872 TaxID=2783812 RepID=UPI001E28C399|nr:hypothetical protein [Clavibacter sp. VKM Ac-2872]